MKIKTVCFYFIPIFLLFFSLSNYIRAESPIWIENQYFAAGSEEYNEVNPKLPSAVQAKFINSKHQVIVGMLDSGVDFTHPKIIQNMHYLISPTLRLGFDFVGNDGVPSPRLYSPGMMMRMSSLEKAMAHGTHVAGIIAGGNAKIGIIPYRLGFVSKNPSTTFLDHLGNNLDAASVRESVRHLTNGFIDAVKQGARIVNISMEYSKNMDMPDIEQLVRPSVLKEMFKPFQKYSQTIATNTLIVVAAGNETKDVSSGVRSFPCQLRSGNVLCVGSVNNKLGISDFSNNGLQFVDVYAPGESIKSSVPIETASYRDDPYEEMTGTSQATAFVTNLAAKMLLVKPCLSSRDLIEIIKKTAVEKTANVKVGNMRTNQLYKYKIVNPILALSIASRFTCK